MTIFRRILLILSTIIMVLPSLNSTASNLTLIDENFQSTTHLDMDKTTATVDTNVGQVHLPKVSGLQSWHATDDAVITMDGNNIHFFKTNASGKLEQDSTLSHAVSGNIVGVKFAPNGWDHYVLTDDGNIYKFQYTGAQFIENPSYRLSGFVSAVAFTVNDVGASVMDRNKILTANDSNNGFETPAETFSTTATGDLQYLSGSGSDLAMTDSDGNVQILNYTGTNYVQNPLYSMNGIGPADEVEKNIVAVKNDTVSTYDNQINISVLSFTATGAVNAVASKGGAIYVRDDNKITKYLWTGSDYIIASSVTGLSAVQSTYLGPRQVQGAFYSLPQPIQRFGVSYVATIPEQTKIQVFISGDGSTWHDATNLPSGYIQLPSPVSQLTFKAILSTDNILITPMLKHITITDRSLFVDTWTTTDIVHEPEGNPPLPTTLPVNLDGGFNFSFIVSAPGATSITIQFSNGETASAIDKGGYQFVGTHYFPEDAPYGPINVTVTAKDTDGNTYIKDFPAQYNIVGNLKSLVKVVDTK